MKLFRKVYFKYLICIFDQNQSNFDKMSNQHFDKGRFMDNMQIDDHLYEKAKRYALLT